MTEDNNFNLPFMELCNGPKEKDAVSELAAKRYSINRLRDFGYKDEEIEQLLAIKL